jgi:hypothetical protein
LMDITLKLIVQSQKSAIRLVRWYCVIAIFIPFRCDISTKWFRFTRAAKFSNNSTISSWVSHGHATDGQSP